MRLIVTKTLRLQEFPSEDMYPPYAVLVAQFG